MDPESDAVVDVVRSVTVPLTGADWRFDPDFETEVDVSFAEESPGGTRVNLRHRNLQRYGEATEQMRAVFDAPDGWTGTLARFVGVANKGDNR